MFFGLYFVKKRTSFFPQKMVPERSHSSITNFLIARPDKLRDHEKVHLTTGNGNRGRNKKFVKEEPEEDSDGMLDEIDENDENAIEEFIGKFHAGEIHIFS